MGTVRKPRVAVYGGDERNERLDWPRHLDIQIYPYKSPRSADRLREALSSGSIDHLVLLTGYIGHGHSSGLKDYGVNVINWNRSPGSLSRELGQLIPPTLQPVNPLLRPSKPEEVTGGGRGPLTNKLEVELTIPPKFEHVVTTPPRENETLGQALRRILTAENMSQAELCRLLERPQATVSSWMRDSSRPRDMGPLVDLWPELSKFDLEHEYKVPPTAKPAEDKVHDELIKLIRSVRMEEKVAQAPVADTILPHVLRWKQALERFRAAKDELEKAEMELLANIPGV